MCAASADTLPPCLNAASCSLRRSWKTYAQVRMPEADLLHLVTTLTPLHVHIFVSTLYT